LWEWDEIRDESVRLKEPPQHPRAWQTPQKQIVDMM